MILLGIYHFYIFLHIAIILVQCHSGAAYLSGHGTRGRNTPVAGANATNTLIVLVIALA